MGLKMLKWIIIENVGQGLEPRLGQGLRQGQGLGSFSKMGT